MSMSTLSLTSPIHEGITPFSSVPMLSLSWPATGGQPTSKATDTAAVSKPPPQAQKPVRTKQKISRWVLFNLWFNTYKKFFTFVTLLNLAGIIMAALGRFPYAENHLGALVLGNLLCAVLMRNELFLRCLYIIAIYGLRGVRIYFLTLSSVHRGLSSNMDLTQWAPVTVKLAATSILQHVGGIHSGCALSGAG
jgi:hypothetical protein